MLARRNNQNRLILKNLDFQNVYELVTFVARLWLIWTLEKQNGWVNLGSDRSFCLSVPTLFHSFSLYKNLQILLKHNFVRSYSLDTEMLTLSSNTENIKKTGKHMFIAIH